MPEQRSPEPTRQEQAQAFINGIKAELQIPARLDPFFDKAIEAVSHADNRIKLAGVAQSAIASAFEYYTYQESTPDFLHPGETFYMEQVEIGFNKYTIFRYKENNDSSGEHTVIIVGDTEVSNKSQLPPYYKKFTPQEIPQVMERIKQSPVLFRTRKGWIQGENVQNKEMISSESPEDNFAREAAGFSVLEDMRNALSYSGPDGNVFQQADEILKEMRADGSTFEEEAREAISKRREETRQFLLDCLEVCIVDQELGSRIVGSPSFLQTLRAAKVMYDNALVHAEVAPAEKKQLQTVLRDWIVLEFLHNFALEVEGDKRNNFANVRTRYGSDDVIKVIEFTRTLYRKSQSAIDTYLLPLQYITLEQLNQIDSEQSFDRIRKNLAEFGAQGKKDKPNFPYEDGLRAKDWADKLCKRIYFCLTGVEDVDSYLDKS